MGGGRVERKWGEDAREREREMGRDMGERLKGKGETESMNNGSDIWKGHK